MIISLEKPGSPAEILAETLNHHGIKGQRWGIRKERDTVSRPKTSEERAAQIAHRKKVAKNVAIGTGILVAAAGAAYVGYKLHQSGHLPLSSLKKSTPKNAVPEAKKIVEQTDIIHLARGKHKGLHFLNQGGTPDHFSIWEKALGKYAHTSERDIFNKLPDGSIASRFLDPSGRVDGSGRPITHEVIIPRSMASGITNNNDVKSKIWPLLKSTYDTMFTSSLEDRR